MNRSTYLLSILFLFLQSCVDPVVPTYDYVTGFILVEGNITAGTVTSEVRLRRSSLSFGSYQLDPLVSAQVFSVGGNGEEITWSPTNEPGFFRPPPDFQPVPGTAYFLRIQLASGELIESEPEVIPAPVEISNLRMTFDQEAYYSDSRERFVPAFTLLADIQDPEETDNFFRFGYRTWAQVSICQTCFNSVYRNGVCVETPASRRIPKYDYLCAAPCWSITKGSAIRILSDELNPGGSFTAVPAARIDYVGSGKLLAEVEQYAITREAYLYYDVLRDLTEGSAGLNAPLPAPLYGNLVDKSDLETTILGFVGGNSVTTQRLLWNRDSINGEPLTLPAPPVLEPLEPNPPTAPCDGPDRTTEEPAGWNS